MGLAVAADPGTRPRLLRLWASREAVKEAGSRARLHHGLRPLQARDLRRSRNFGRYAPSRLLAESELLAVTFCAAPFSGRRRELSVGACILSATGRHAGSPRRSGELAAVEMSKQAARVVSISRGPFERVGDVAPREQVKVARRRGQPNRQRSLRRGRAGRLSGRSALPLHYRWPFYPIH